MQIWLPLQILQGCCIKDGDWSLSTFLGTWVLHSLASLCFSLPPSALTLDSMLQKYHVTFISPQYSRLPHSSGTIASATFFIWNLWPLWASWMHVSSISLTSYSQNLAWHLHYGWNKCPFISSPTFAVWTIKPRTHLRSCNFCSSYCNFLYPCLLTPAQWRDLSL